jgi:hypothetical protein
LEVALHNVAHLEAGNWQFMLVLTVQFALPVMQQPHQQGGQKGQHQLRLEEHLT